MHILPWSRRFRISTKLLVMTGAICGVFALIILIVLISFRNIGSLSLSTIESGVDRVVENARIERGLAEVFSEVDILLHTYHSSEQGVEAEKDRINGQLSELSERLQEVGISESLDDYTRLLNSMLEYAKKLNDLDAEIAELDKAFQIDLQNLDLIISDNIIDSVLQEKESTVWEQLSVRVAGFRERLLTVGRLYVEMRHSSDDSVLEVDIVSALDDLRLKLMTLTAFGKDIDIYRDKLVRKIVRLKALILEYIRARIELDIRIDRLAAEKQDVITAMKQLDEDIARTSGSIQTEISDTLFSSGMIILILSVTVVVGLGFLTTYFIISNIRRPMQGIQNSIDAFRGGDSSARILLNRRDEWKVLEDAWNAMADELLEFLNERRLAEEKLAELNRNLEHQVRERTKALSEKAEELAKANTALLELDAMKSAFLSSVSHELRTPLTSILGFAKLIKKDFHRDFFSFAEDNDLLQRKGRRITDNLDVIAREGERLGRLINDVLDLNRIESGRMEWHNRVHPASKVLMSGVQAMEGVFSGKKDVELVVEIPQNLPEVFVDDDKIRQVIINLLSNAAKFTEKGTVSVAASVDEGILTVMVSDTGPGIPKRFQEKVFDKFQQVEEDTLRDKPKGSGLGLAICRRIVEHYGGVVWLESEGGKGSSFYFTLPVSTKIPAVDTPDDGEYWAGDQYITKRPDMRLRPLVLVVDDDVSVNSYLRQLFEGEGYDTVAAYDGDSALKQAVEFHPDLITMDIMMPNMDGKTAISFLRKDPDLAEIPVLVLSVLKEAHDAGGDMALTKPIDEERLRASAADLLGRSQSCNPVMVLRRNGPEQLGSYFTLCTGEIRQCSEDEMWQTIEKGFQGTIIIPGKAAEMVDINKLAALDGVQVVLMPTK